MKTNKTIANLFTPSAFSIFAKCSNLAFRRILEEGSKQMSLNGMPYFTKVVPLEVIKNAAYQRDVDPAMVRKIQKEFDPKLVEPIVINYDPETGEAVAIDGNHTLLALLEMGYTHWECRVYIGLSKGEQAKVFSNQYKKRRKITDYDSFKALLWSEAPEAIAIKEVLDKHNVVLGKARKPRTITSIQKTSKIMQIFGASGMEYILKMIEDAGWDNYINGYTQHVLSIGQMTYEACHEDIGAYRTLINMMSSTNPTEIKHTAQTEKARKAINFSEDCVGRYALELVMSAK